jgi:hypothetical protein
MTDRDRGSGRRRPLRDCGGGKERDSQFTSA